MTLKFKLHQKLSVNKKHDHYDVHSVMCMTTIWCAWPLWCALWCAWPLWCA